MILWVLFIYIFTIANIPVQTGYLTKVLHTSSQCSNALSFVYSIPDIPYSVVLFCIGDPSSVCYILVKNWPLFCRGQRNGRVVQNGMSENDSLQVHCRYSFRAIKLLRDKTRIGFNPWYKKQKGFTWENNPKLDEINFSEEITINLWKSWSFRARHSPHLVIPDLASVMHRLPPCILDTRLALNIQRVVSNL